MKAVVEVNKSFDTDVSRFSKTYDAGDLKEFFEAEGGYLDTLSKALEVHGDDGDTFTVVYTVKITK